MKAIVVQKGAREHYLIARSLHSNQMLAGLVVDWYPKFLSGKLFSRFADRNKLLSKASSAYCHDIPDDLVTAKNCYGLIYRIQARFAGQSEIFKTYLKSDAHFSRMITNLKLPDHNIMICYSYAALEALCHAKANKKFAVLDQIDPGPIEREIVAEEEKKWPHYVDRHLTINQDYEDRVRKEWQVADLIIVNSEWSAQLLRQQGVLNEKIEVLPLAYNSPSVKVNLETIPDKWTMNRKLRVLWLGQVILRKGIQYLIEAAKDLVKEPLEFFIAGSIGIPRKILSEAPDNIHWLGNIPRSQVPQYYEMADIFILPTISDGFAITQIEALSFGIPAIVTPNCARVVENGKTGFVVPAADVLALVQALRRFLENPGLILRMKRNCLSIKDDYSIEAHSRRLKSILMERMAGKL